MIVYLIRHGQAHEQSDTGQDADRTLTTQGLAQANAIARFLTQQGDNTPTSVLASPYQRTTQTATSIWDALDLPHRSEDRLAAHRTVSDILEVISQAQIQSQSQVPVLAVISHNPIISRTVDVLTDGPSAQQVQWMRPGQLIGLTIDQSNPLGSALPLVEYRLND